MRKLFHRSKLLLLFFSGEDKYIIEQCEDNKIQSSFLRIGFLVALIFIGSCISATAFIAHIIEDNKWLSFPIGILWAFIVANLYILLLYTVSPAILPTRIHPSKKKKIIVAPIATANNKATKDISASLILRVVFMLVLAIIIAQPLNVLFCSSFAETSLKTFKTEYRINMIVSADSNLIKQEMTEKKAMMFTQTILNNNDNSNYQLIENKINDDEIFLKDSKKGLDSLKKWDNFSFINKKQKCDSARNALDALIDKEIESDKKFIATISAMTTSNQPLQSCITRTKENIEAKINSYNTLTNLLEKSDFYVEKIKILLRENPVAWLITLLVCAMFLVPIRWKYRIRNTTNFYEVKKKIEHKIIMNEYAEFKILFSEIFKEKYKEYNRRTLQQFLPLIEKLKLINPKMYANIKQDLDNELKYKTIEKYEYWADAPFRTIPKTKFNNLNDESDFINKIYS